MRASLLLSALIGSSLSTFDAAVSATDVIGRIAWNSILPDVSHISIDSKVTLRSSDFHQASITRDGSFVLQGVKPGKYVLRARCREFAFPSLLIEIPSSTGVSEHVVPIVKPHIFGQADPPPPVPGEPQPFQTSLEYPIQLVALYKIQYEEITMGFNPIAMLLGNPLYLLMGGMAIFMMLMPKLMGMIDPEALAEVQANQASMHKQMASIQDMDFTSGLSTILSASGDGNSAASAQPNAAKSTSRGGDHNSAKKRK